MLSVWGRRHPICDNATRRSFLKAGALGVGGLMLPELLRAREAAPDKAERQKAVIMVCLRFGPSHLDRYDMKPDAPDKVRGEFRPSRTTVPGLDVCELMPLHAKIADRLAVVRNLVFKQ